MHVKVHGKRDTDALDRIRSVYAAKPLRRFKTIK